jgi:hypothetical protein
MNFIFAILASSVPLFFGFYLLQRGMDEVFIKYQYNKPYPTWKVVVWFFAVQAGSLMMFAAFILGIWISRGFK